MERILVVDDEPDIVHFLAEELRRRGYAVDAAFNGEEAVRKVKSVRPHLVLLDIKMPGKDGLAILREIRHVDPVVAVIIMTAIHDEKIAEKALQIGACGYVKKPFEFEHLSAVMTGALDRLATGT